MRSGLGGHETLNLYAEAITEMPENPGIPLLFRDIFKNAYLPYRDPETLKMFLKVIDEFTYDHSERLGDAFEYLLSVLGSQGDAGQFRTPRHIIDFIVAIVNPKKTETILDPACGTAGFLISSYKHILAANTDKKGHSKLTPDEKGRLAKNFKGYDISPDMVRLSLVNLYLHGFTDPHIDEYDTLTSEDKWNEFADVILANPPFMSPKGGIKPHKRFSVQSKRSEVLFVDYRAEHLTPSGRAGIIVPEGIIFQSQTAYKKLRQMLVESYLVAVISLPAGVFNPYSGVKTSILLLDKSLAKQSDTIAFFKIENDGFGLGAQRRANVGEELTQVRAEIAEYFRRLRARESLEDFQPTLGLVVAKEKIATNGDYNLSGERYRAGIVATGTWPMVTLGSIATFASGGTPSKANESYWVGDIPWVSAKDMKSDLLHDASTHISEIAVNESSTKIAPGGSLLILVRGMGLANAIPICELTTPCAFNQDVRAIRPESTVNATYLRLMLKSAEPQFRRIIETAAHGTLKINTEDLSQIELPLPPLALQQEIVAEIEGYQTEIRNYELQIAKCREKISRTIDKVWGTDEQA